MANETLKGFLTGIANAIRSKDKTTAKIPAQDMEARIRAITTGVDTSDATATADDIIKPLTAYVKGSKVVGALTATSSSAVTGSASELGWASYNKTVTVRHRFSDSKRTVFSAGGMLQLDYENGEFGDAKTENVLPGVTYTSNASGIKQYGNAHYMLTQTSVEGIYRTGTSRLVFPSAIDISDKWNSAYSSIDWEPRIVWLKIYYPFATSIPDSQEDPWGVLAIEITPAFGEVTPNSDGAIAAAHACFATTSYTQFAADSRVVANSSSMYGLSFTHSGTGKYDVIWDLSNTGQFSGSEYHFIPNLEYRILCVYY